jgi:hypothetical protein
LVNCVGDVGREDPDDEVNEAYENDDEDEDSRKSEATWISSILS